MAAEKRRLGRLCMSHGPTVPGRPRSHVPGTEPFPMLQSRLFPLLRRAADGPGRFCWLGHSLYCFDSERLQRSETTVCVPSVGGSSIFLPFVFARSPKESFKTNTGTSEKPRSSRLGAVIIDSVENRKGRRQAAQAQALGLVYAVYTMMYTALPALPPSRTRER